MELIYLDHSATTPMHPEVIEKIGQIMPTIYGNPSSVHRFGREAHRLLENARELIAASLKVQAHEIIFTSGGTEGDNAAIIETALSKQHLGKHIITTRVEHPAVLETMRYLEMLGFDVTYLPVDKQGKLAAKQVKTALREETILVSIMYGNNETGILFPIQEIGELLKEHTAVFHTDAVQAYGAIDIQPYLLNVDLLSISGHKINGPKGVGFLFKRDGVQLPSFIHGGEQEEKRRAGTENLIGIAGLAKAVSLLSTAEKEARAEKYATFFDKIIQRLEEAAIDFHINGERESQLPHILNLWFPNVSNDLLLMQLDLKGIAISTGSACTAGNVEPSHVLEAMYGENHPAIKESVRISVGYGNTIEEIEYFSEILVETVQRLQK